MPSKQDFEPSASFKFKIPDTMFVCDSAMDCAGARLRTYKSCRCVVTSAVAAQSTKQQMLPQPFSHLRSPCLSQHLSVLTFPSTARPSRGPSNSPSLRMMNGLPDKPCRDLLTMFLQTMSPDYLPLPENTDDVVMNCVKMSDTTQGIPATDAGTTQDCTVFLSFPVPFTVKEVPTKRFSFVCRRPEEARPAPTNAIVSIMVQAASGSIHLPSKRAFRSMNNKDHLETTRSFGGVEVAPPCLPVL